MEEKYIVVIGGCCLDETYLQHEDGSYSDVPDFSVPGGKAANQAVAASLAGAKVKIITRLGDANSSVTKNIIESLKQKSVDVTCVECDSAVNNDVAKIRIKYSNHDNEIERFAGAINSFYPEMVQKYADVIKGASFVIAQMKAPKEFSVELINFCYSNNIPISITPCRPEKLSVNDPANIDLINKITYITANKNECEIMFNNLPIQKCVEMFPNKLIVTLGEDGLMFHDGNKIVHISSINIKNVVDTSGAGDTLAGNFIANLIAGMTVNDSLKRSTYASAMAIQQKTAQKGMPTKAELDSFIRHYEENCEV